MPQSHEIFDKVTTTQIAPSKYEKKKKKKKTN
jgi:hypothetical protein